MIPPTPIDDDFLVAGQIYPSEMPALARQGITLIVNNRPDGEEDDQPSASEIARAADAAGIAYRAIPVAPEGILDGQIAEMAEVLRGHHGKTLAFCFSGTRSALLWALAEASRGRCPDDLAQQLRAADYRPDAIMDRMHSLAGAFCF